MTPADELERCRPWLEAALERSGGTHTWQDIRDAIALGKMQFWPGKEAAAVTEIIEYPRRLSLHVFLAGGNLDELLVMMNSAKVWAVAQGCDGMTMSGRRGFLRVLNNHGWRDLCATMMLDLKGDE